ncbi:fused MFS/spermidine synthase [Paenarthrobacter sp. PH39-S1]|uniref:spermidine synthase n=1 Tax=Paenarthrobacter sp. PH39-S1 TaxID=3046204 RepID=UPI0024BAF6BE|nr:fused MFS/spermidine synthase [Paenarthrobacter sp. PH39-S1]MDJ0354935.1 fused MFS/spermidine synthase [Paenarthrobacter sp. PH39-S1]
MGRQRTPKAGVESPSGGSGGPAAGTYEIDTGRAELIPDGDNPNGWLLKLNGVQSSHVDLADPLRLDFEYMRWIMALVQSRWPVPSGWSRDKLRALHLGGAACSMARYLVAVYPESRNVVVEIDAKLAEYVRSWFDLPRAPLLKIRVGEARLVTESLADASRDLIIRDVFAGAFTPKPLTTAEFIGQVRRVLAPGGVYVVNCGDAPALTLARREAATISGAFQHTAAIADPAMLKGRRYGNIIIAGSDSPLGQSPTLPRELLAGAVPAHLWNDSQVRSFGRTAQVLTDKSAP